MVTIIWFDNNYSIIKMIIAHINFARVPFVYVLDLFVQFILRLSKPYPGYVIKTLRQIPKIISDVRLAANTTTDNFPLSSHKTLLLASASLPRPRRGSSVLRG